MTATRPRVEAPSTTADVQAQIRDATSRGRALRIVGGASWLDANRPVRADDTLATSALSGIVEYEPGDLTLTARAGTTLDEIARATAAHGQWLAFDPPGDATRATIGAAIATASYGPLAHHFGTPRDMTLGVEFVAGTGEAVRGGGRVVKNVAGFDLTRLVTGSWGTLGVLTEVTVRLRALPAMESTLALDVRSDPEEVERMRRALRELPFVPLAAHWIHETLATALGLSTGHAAVVVRLGGNEDAVRAQCAAIESLGAARHIPSEVWHRLQTSEPAGSATLRLSRLPTRFAATWTDAQRVVGRWPGGYCHGDAGRGVVRCVLPPTNEQPDHDRLRAVLALPFDGTRIVERLPAALWTHVPPALHHPLEQRVKTAFDPKRVLNPGILGEAQ